MNKHIIIGIDPGEKYTGLAALTLTPNLSGGCAFTAVMEGDLLQPARWLDEVLGDYTLDSLDVIHVVCEEFRIRPHKYESFASGGTLQLIGALRYVGETKEDYGFMLRPAQLIPLEQMKKTSLYKWLHDWKRTWPSNTARCWRHAIDAWRVILHHALTSEYQELREGRVFESLYNITSDEIGSAFVEYLPDNLKYVAPEIMWNWGSK